MVSARRNFHRFLYDSVFFRNQASVPGVPDGGGGSDPSAFGTLPASGPLPPHLLVKQETGMTNTFHRVRAQIKLLLGHVLFVSVGILSVPAVARAALNLALVLRHRAGLCSGSWSDWPRLLGLEQSPVGPRS